MAILLKLAGYILFVILAVALFSKATHPDLTFASPGLGIGMAIALGMIAIGYLGDIADAVEDMVREQKKLREPPQEP